jgi:tRNA 2-thiouridine synthesizing protein E
MAYHIKIKDKKYLLTEQDYLVNGDNWDSVIRDWLADKEGLKLDQEHLDAIEFIRQTYQRRQVHPNPRTIAASLAQKYGSGKGSLRYFYRLFPRGAQQAFAIAGVPMQGFCF